MKTIKLIIRENLVRQDFINETFKRISTYKNDQERFNSVIGLFRKLIREGYSERELNQIIKEQETNPLSGLASIFGNKPTSNDASTLNKIESGEVDSGGWGIREWAYREFLSIFGFTGTGAKILAAAMNRMSISDIVSIFNSKEGCYAHSEAVSTGLSAGLLTAMFEPDSTAGNYFKQLAITYFKNNGYEKQLGMFLCDAYYNSNNRSSSQQNNQPQSQTIPTQNNQLQNKPSLKSTRF